MTKEDVKIIIDATKRAKNEPYVVQEVYVSDFKLMIHWDDMRDWFECCLHWSPRGSSYYHYGRTQEDLVLQMEETMSEFGGKGNYKKVKL